MEFLIDFNEITKNDIEIAGGKGASLGELKNAGMPVPNGFVIVSGVFEYFIGSNNIKPEIDSIISSLNIHDLELIEIASNKIRNLIIDSKIESTLETQILRKFEELSCEYAAVRSSATAEDSNEASWAGELETYLNSTKENIIENIKKCWASLFTPRAIFYRIEKAMQNRKVSVAVVVQEMVQSEVSGVAFTAHPISRDKNKVLIEAGWGLGEAIVSGIITPDSYIIDKNELAIDEINITQQDFMIAKKDKITDRVDVPQDKIKTQKLDGRKIVELAKICLEIEEHYKFPCDIEWAYVNDKFYIVQARPITTLK